MNKPRLIDANTLVKYMQTQKPIITLDDIARFPTAYDIDKVLEQLDKRCSFRLAYNTILGKDYEDGLIEGFNDAIEIVKGGTG